MTDLEISKALAQARVQAITECANKAEGYMIQQYGFDYGVMAEILGLIGAKT